MLKHLVFAIAAVVGVMATPALAKDYIVVDYEDDLTMIRALDRASIAPVKDDIKQAWVVTVMQGAAVEDGIVRRRALIWYDCAALRSAIYTVETYTATGSPPANSWTYDGADFEWDDVKADSVGGYTRDIVCGTEAIADEDIVQAADDDELQQIFAEAYAKDAK